MKRTTQELIILEDAFPDNLALAIEFKDDSDIARYFLQGHSRIASCLIAVGTCNKDWTDEQHIAAVKKAIGEEKLEKYIKKIKTLTKFAIENTYI